MRGTIGAAGRGSGAGATGGARAPTRAGAGGFVLPPATSAPAGAPAPAPHAEAGAVAGLGLLALQALGAPPGGAARPMTARARDAAGQKRAESLLEELAQLQRGMLSGAVDRASLERLSSLEEGEDGADPTLREVVRAIALRAAVELARREVTPARGRGAPATTS